MSRVRRTGIAIVGGGPAGAALAIALARAGREVTLFERLREPRWRAGGVYASPRTRGQLADLDLDPVAVARLVRPIAAMEVRTTTGARCRLEHREPFACGIDRVRLEQALLDRAAEAGARVLQGWPVRSVHLRGGPADRARLATSDPAGDPVDWEAELVVGADGPRSLVARAAGVDRSHRRYRRAGITVHHADPAALPPTEPATATMTIGPGWYCGVAPVPGARVNVGIVLGAAALTRELRRHPGGAAGVVRRIVAQLPGPPEAWRDAPPTDAVAVALPLAHRPRRVGGSGWLLVGDAAGFIDPLSGEGLHRALASAARAAGAILGDGRGVPDPDGYHRSMRARYRGKDAVSWLLQGFLARPELAAYAVTRLARRPALARTFNDVLTDLAPASRALDPRFLARVLIP